MIRPWKKGTSETLVKKFGKEIRKTLFANPATQVEEEFYLIGQKDWSVTLPVTEDGNVVLAREYNQGCDKIITHMPGGTADFSNESPEELARRELLEETGYAAEKMIFLGPPMWMTGRNSWTRFFIFLGLGCKKVQEGKIDTSEEIETVLMPWKEWAQFCMKESEEPSNPIATFRAMPYVNFP